MPPSRRALLRAVAAGLSPALAGCGGRTGPDGDPTDTSPAPLPTDTSPGPTPTGTETAPPTASPATGEGVAWHYRTGARSVPATPEGRTPCFNCGGVRSQPTVAGGTVYVAADALYALDRAGGTERWTHDVGAPTTGPPLVRGDVVYAVHGRHSGFVCERCTIVATDAETGTERWTYTAPVAPVARLGFLASSPDTLFVNLRNDDVIGDYGSYTFALGAATGEVRWRVDTSDAYGTTLLDDLLYVQSAPASLWAIEPATGEVRWSIDPATPDDSFLGFEPAVVDGLVFVAESGGAATGALYGIDAATGERRWRFSPESAPIFDYTLHPAGLMVYAEPPGYLGGAVYAVDPASGRLEWTYRPSESVLVATAEHLLVRDGPTLHDVDPDTGRRRWAVDPGMADGFWATVADDAVLLLDGEGGTVRALDLADGGERWRYAVDRAAGRFLTHVYLGADTVFVEVSISKDPDRGAIDALSPATGERRWRFAPPAAMSYPTVVGNVAYLGTADGLVYALDGRPA